MAVLQAEQAIGGGCCFIIILVSVILFACSFDTLEPRYYALIYDDTYKTVPRNDIRREQDTDGGRPLIGLGRSFLRFPKGYVTMSWTGSSPTDGGGMACWSKDGQDVSIDMSLQVAVVKEKLPQLYYQWGLHYRDHLRLLIQREIKDTSTRFTTLEFFTNRLEISSAFEAAITARLAKDDLFKLVYIQLREIDLPDKFETAILSKILKLQEQKTAIFEQDAMQRQELILREELEAEAWAQRELAGATAMGDLLVAQLGADGERKILEIHAAKFKELAEKMGWLGNPELGQKALQFYIWSRLAKSTAAQTARHMIGFDGAVVNV